MSRLARRGVLNARSAPPGQYLFPNGSTTWAVPEGVTRVSGVMVGPGGESTPTTSGGGGGLIWFNDFPVESGKSFTCNNANNEVRLYYGPTPLVELCVVNKATTTGELPIASPDLSNVVSALGRFAGGNGVTVATASGAGAAGYTTNGQSSIVDVAKGGGGASLLGGGAAGNNAGASPTVHGQLYGGGGAVVSGVGVGSGQRGGCRLIWGSGRAFPNTNTGDV